MSIFEVKLTIFLKSKFKWFGLKIEVGGKKKETLAGFEREWM